MNKLKEYIDQGSAIDKQTNELFQTIDKTLITSEIKLPESNDPLTNKIKQVIQERSEHIEKTKRKSSEYRILPKIISSYKKSGTTDFEPIFIEHLKYFDEDLRYVNDTKQENMKLIHEIERKENNKTNESGKTKKMERTDPRELYIEDLKYSLGLLDEVKDNLNAGTTFYENLINSTNTFCNEVREFDETRRIEKTKLDESLILEGQ